MISVDEPGTGDPQIVSNLINAGCLQLFEIGVQFEDFVLEAGLAVGEIITAIGTIFGSVVWPNYAPGNGTLTEFFLWDDPTPDMQFLADCVLRYQEIVTIINCDTDIHAWYPLTNGPVQVLEQDFWIAFRLPHNVYEFCLSIDETSVYVPGSAFYTGCNGTQWGFHPEQLDHPDNIYPPIESTYGFWTVRAGY